MREVNGIKYVNDSKATTVEAVLRALSAFSEPIVLILGGKDKGNDYSRMRDAVKKNVRAIVAVGHSAEKIVHNFTGTVPVERVDTIGTDIPNIASMRKTVAVATALAQRGDSSCSRRHARHSIGLQILKNVDGSLSRRYIHSD